MKPSLSATIWMLQICWNTKSNLTELLFVFERDDCIFLRVQFCEPSDKAHSTRKHPETERLQNQCIVI